MLSFFPLNIVSTASSAYKLEYTAIYQRLQQVACLIVTNPTEFDNVPPGNLPVGLNILEDHLFHLQPFEPPSPDVRCWLAHFAVHTCTKMICAASSFGFQPGLRATRAGSGDQGVVLSQCHHPPRR